MLEFYALEKKVIWYEYCYKNNFNSKIFAKARLNALQLEEHKGRGKDHYDKTCKLCNKDTENIVHFIITCKKLESKRNYKVINKNIRNPEIRMRILLFRNKNHQDVSNTLMDLWELRKVLLKQLENKKAINSVT